jgi:hypothetical protein
MHLQKKPIHDDLDLGVVGYKISEDTHPVAHFGACVAIHEMPLNTGTMLLNEITRTDRFIDKISEPDDVDAHHDEVDAINPPSGDTPLWYRQGLPTDSEMLALDERTWELRARQMLRRSKMPLTPYNVHGAVLILKKKYKTKMSDIFKRHRKPRH